LEQLCFVFNLNAHFLDKVATMKLDSILLLATAALSSAAIFNTVSFLVWLVGAVGAVALVIISEKE